MDAGAELYDYVADITRTWPANGKFTPAQADVYNAVLSAQVDLIEVFLLFTLFFSDTMLEPSVRLQNCKYIFCLYRGVE